MKHLTWLCLFLALSYLFVGCGDDDDDDDILPSAEPVAYIVNQLSLTISSFDSVTQEVTRDVHFVGNAPNDIKIHGDSAYVVNTFDSNLQIIDLNSGASELVDLGEGSSPEEIALVSDSKAYVTAGTTDSVKVVDLNSRTMTKEIPVGVAPWGVAVTQGKAYVINSNYDFVNFAPRQGSVSVIDTATDEVTQTIDAGMNPQEIALDPQGNVLVLCTGNYADVMGSVVIIDASSDTASAAVDLNTIPSGIIVRQDGTAFITFSNFLTGNSGLLVLDTTSNALTRGATDPLIPGMAGMGMATDSLGTLYVAIPNWDGSNTDKLVVIDEMNQVLGTYDIGDGGGAASFIAIRE